MTSPTAIRAAFARARQLSPLGQAGPSPPTPPAVRSASPMRMLTAKNIDLFCTMLEHERRAAKAMSGAKHSPQQTTLEV